MFASLNWTNSSPEAARARSIAETQGVVGKLLEAPAANATVDRIYIGSYTQAEIEVAVDFHLGTKVCLCVVNVFVCLFVGTLLLCVLVCWHATVCVCVCFILCVGKLSCV